MLPSAKCIICGKELQLVKFAYRQEICWDCFKEEIKNIIFNIDNMYALSDSISVNDKKKHKEYISYLLAVTAEMFGEEWK